MMLQSLRPPRYVLASVAISLAGLCNGYDTGSIGALTTMPQFTAVIGPLSPSLLGFTISLVMLTGAVPSIFAGYLADRFGRLRTILLGALLYVIGAALQGSANTLPQFLVGRAIGGFGQGVFLSNVSVYICEIAPARHRGMIAGLPQFQCTAGVCLGYFTCYGSVHVASSMAWRLPYVVQAILGAVLALSCAVLPESPRWLVLHGRLPMALQSLRKLDFDMVEAERDFLTVTTEQQPSLSPWQSVAILFKRGYRARTILALFILGMVQLSGIDAVIYVSPSGRSLTRNHSRSIGSNDPNSTPPFSSRRPAFPAPRHLSSPRASPPLACLSSPSQPSSSPTDGVAAPRPSAVASRSPPACSSWVFYMPLVWFIPGAPRAGSSSSASLFSVSRIARHGALWVKSTPLRFSQGTQGRLPIASPRDLVL